MKTRTAAIKKGQIEKKSASKFWVSGLVVTLAIGACVAVYKHSAPFQANLPVAATPAEANQTTAPAVSTAGTPAPKTSAPEMRAVTFGPTIQNATTLPAK